MDYGVLGAVMELVLTDPYYAKKTISGQRNSVYYAIKHGKYMVHRVNGKVAGFCAYGFFTQEEIDSDLWNGDEAYAREDGEVFYFTKFQCRLGFREVIKFARDVRLAVSKKYPDKEIGNGVRIYPDGGRRDEKWHRKVA